MRQLTTAVDKPATLLITPPARDRATMGRRRRESCSSFIGPAVLSLQTLSRLRLPYPAQGSIYIHCVIKGNIQAPAWHMEQVRQLWIFQDASFIHIISVVKPAAPREPAYEAIMPP